ncbi:hypothetical protein [Sphingomicrobium nitratireducens]|uniref:hypothetical protein n=1 Tax=Sphingomicrobium nitratireducens TaxID=2964666 RepID=UPI00223FC99C|nr:hypothetical protein [Sphingomicrobium nitratireducens]
MDRRLIQVDFPPAHAGIAAALRRAFADAARPRVAEDDVAQEFDDLLARLN